MSRVDAVRIAIEKARELGHSLEGAVLASDAFFPFADGPQLALDAGVAAVHPARRIEARRRGDRGGLGGRRGDGLHRPPPLQALMDDFDLDVRRHVYFSVVANGRPPTTTETASAFGRDEEEIVDAYVRLHDAHALVLFPDSTEIWMANPFCFAPTPHRVAAGGRRRGPGRAAGTRSGSLARFTPTARSRLSARAAASALELVVQGGELAVGADVLMPHPRPGAALVG